MASLYDFSPSPSRAGAPPVPLARGECMYTSQYCEENVWHLLQRLAAVDALPRVGSADDSLSAMASPRLSPPVPDIASDADADAAADMRSAVPDITVREHARSQSLSPVAPWPVHVGAGGRTATANIGSGAALELYGVFITNANRQAMIWCQRAARTPSSFVVWDYHVIVIARDPRSGAAWVYDLDTTLDFPCSLDEYLWKSFRPNIRMDPHFVSYFRVVPAALFLAHFASDRSHMLAEDGTTYLATPPPYPPIRTPLHTMTLMHYLDLNRETVGAQSPTDTLVVRVNGLARRFGVKWPSPIADDFGLHIASPDTGRWSGASADTDMDGAAAAVPHERTWSGSATTGGVSVGSPDAGSTDGAGASSAPRHQFELAPSQLEALLGRRGSAPGPSLPWS